MMRFLLGVSLFFSGQAQAASQSKILKAAFQKNVLKQDLGQENFKYFVHFETGLKKSQYNPLFLSKALRSVDLIDFSSEPTSSIIFARPSGVNVLTIPNFVTFPDHTVHGVSQYDASGIGYMVQALFYIADSEEGVSNKAGFIELKRFLKKEIVKLHPTLSAESVEELATETLAQSVQYITNDYFLTFKNIQRRCSLGKALSPKYLEALFKIYHPQYLQVQAFIEVDDKPIEYRTTIAGSLNTGFLKALYGDRLTGEISHDFKFLLEGSLCERSRTLPLTD